MTVTLPVVDRMPVPNFGDTSGEGPGWGREFDEWAGAHSTVDGFWYGMATRSFQLH